MPQDPKKMCEVTPALYVVSMPIGNMRDITLRALDILGSADVIACEDPRVTMRVLNAHKIPIPKLVQYTEHSKARHIEHIIDFIQMHNKVVALVCNAGTPLLSDPGHTLVQAATAREVAVVPVGGCSAVTMALASSSMRNGSFMFIGFLPRTNSALRESLRKLSTNKMAIVALESTRRLARALETISETLNDPFVEIMKELSKMHEEILRGTASELITRCKDIRGEAVIIIGPTAGAVHNANNDEEIDIQIMAGLSKGMATRDIAESICDSGSTATRNKRAIYNRVINLKRLRDSE